MSSEQTNTRIRILSATIKLLESGDKTRMADIARAAGVSRQAIYLHFETRADLLIGATRYLDEVNDAGALLAESRASEGVARLDAWIAAWGAYIPMIYPIAKAIRAMIPTDAEAHAAYDERMAAMRHGCEAAIKAVQTAGRLRSEYDAETATDLLWAMLLIPEWEALTKVCGWTETEYIDRQTIAARRLFVA